MKSNLQKFILNSLIILSFWVMINCVFYINDIPNDGEKKIGLPYPIVVSYIDRSNMEIYSIETDINNFVWDILFITLVTLFYYVLFLKYGNKSRSMEKPNKLSTKSETKSNPYTESN